MMSLHGRYLSGVSDLLRAVGQTKAAYLSVLTLQGRLTQVIAEIRQYGLTETARAEIAQVTTELNRLSLAHLGKSFYNLCGVDGLPELPPPEIRHNLPHPDYGQFVGRTLELAKIYELLAPDNRHFLVTIDGIGGIGKSALALETAHHYLHEAAALPESDRFDAIIWTSAKQILLTAEGITHRRQALRTIDDIYSAISVTLGREDITRARPEAQHEIVRGALTQQRVLLVVDNLETVDDEMVMEFLRELPAPTKAIVTTRHRLDVAYPIRLVGMPWEDAKEFIAQECRERDVLLTDDQVRRLYDRTGGVPLALVWSIAQIGLGYDIETILKRLANPQGDLARFCFEGVIGHIRGTAAHKLLMALALSATDASRELLGHVSGLSEEVLSRDEGLVELEKLSLVNKRGNRFALLPLTRSYAQHELASDVDFAHRATQRWMTQLTGLLESQPHWYWIENQAMILQEGENFRSLLELAIAQGDCMTAVEVLRPSVLYLQYTGRRAEALKLALDGKKLARQYSKNAVSAWLCVDAGWIMGQQGTQREALEQIEEGIREYAQLANDMGVCFAKCLLAQALRQSGRLTEAESLLEEIITEASRLEYREGTCIGEFELGKLAREQDDWGRAYMHLSSAYRAVMEFDKLAT